MIRERYAVWNNKGGVGKSTLTFHLATTYAASNPDERVLVVDMCPQANCSMMLLGSGTKGENRLIELETKSSAPTIAGYIDERINLLAGTLKEPSERSGTSGLRRKILHSQATCTCSLETGTLNCLLRRWRTTRMHSSRKGSGAQCTNGFSS